MSGAPSLTIAFLKRLISIILPRFKVKGQPHQLYRTKIVSLFDGIFSAEQKSVPYGEDCGCGSPTIRGAYRKYESCLGAPTIKGAGGPECGLGAPTIRGGLSPGLNPPGPLGRRRDGRGEPPAPVQIIPKTVKKKTIEPGECQCNSRKGNNSNTTCTNVWPPSPKGENLLIGSRNEPIELSSVGKVLTNVEDDKKVHKITVNVEIEIRDKDNNK